MNYLKDKHIISVYKLNNSIYITTDDGIFHFFPKKLSLIVPEFNTGQMEDISQKQVEKLESVLGSECLSDCIINLIQPHPIRYLPCKTNNTIETWGYELKTTKGDVVFTYTLEHDGLGSIDMIFETVEFVPNNAELLTDFI